MAVLWYIVSILAIAVVVGILVGLTTVILAVIGVGIASKHEYPEDE